MKVLEYKWRRGRFFSKRGPFGYYTRGIWEGKVRKKGAPKGGGGNVIRKYCCMRTLKAE